VAGVAAAGGAGPLRPWSFKLEAAASAANCKWGSRPVVAVHRKLQSDTPHTDTTHSPAAQLRFARLLHVVPDQVLVEHGNGERNIAVRWAVDHSLADDLRAPRAEALVRFF